KNARMIPLPGAMMSNRVLWIALALGLFAIVAALFRLRLQQAGGKRKAERVAPPPRAAVTVPSVSLRYDAAAWRRAFVARSVFHRRSIVREAALLAISVIAIVNLSVGTWYTAHPGDSSRWPVTALVAPGISDNLVVFMVLLATLYGGELVWRERQIKADQM